MQVAAVDLGASSGRVMLVEIGPGQLRLTEAHRFANTPRQAAGHLRWDVTALRTGVMHGLRRSLELAPELAGVGVDSWAVDYGLLDGGGRLLADPVHYRDQRTTGVLERIHREVSAAELYALTGIQELSLNTLVQLAAEDPALLAEARTLLLIPDLFGYWLTGQVGAERTNASTTQFLDASTGDWAGPLLERLGLPGAILPPVHEAGVVLGPLLPAVAAELGVGVDPVPLVVSVGSHDTASAVVGVPISEPGAAYISSGTWSLVGLELDAPVLSEASRTANFTNEVGVDGTIRYLRNVMGLWLLQESLRTWQESGDPDVPSGPGGHADLATLLAQATALTPLRHVFDVDHPSLLPPGDQPARIAALCLATGQPAPAGPAETVRAILDSLALAYRRTLRAAQELSGRPVTVVHVVGGGAQNELLCQLTADACGLPVLAGPVEAAAIGNALVQARALGGLTGGLGDLRRLVLDTVTVRRFEPRGPDAAWAAAARRLTG